MKKLLSIILLPLIMLSLTTSSAYAGSAQTNKAKLDPVEIASFAKDVEKYAAIKGARAFIIGRVGRPAKDLPKDIEFTHTAVALYSSIKLADGKTVNGYAIHNLYQDAEQVNRSSLIIDYPTDFFWGVNELKAGIIIPTVELQQRLIATIASGKNQTLHNSNYSVIANPFTDQFQNCTEHTLDILNAAIYQTTNKQKLKLNAEAHFTPQQVHTSPFKLMLGSMILDDVSTKDHKGKVFTATFTTIANYLQQNNLVKEAVVFNHNGDIRKLL
jgi:hypothetical protein